MNCLDSILPFWVQPREVGLHLSFPGDDQNPPVSDALKDPLCGTPWPGLLGSSASVFRDFCIRKHLQKAFDNLKAFENH